MLPSNFYIKNFHFCVESVNNVFLNIGMWGVSPYNFDWQVTTVKSELKLDEPISRKSPKPSENLHFLIKGNFQYIFLRFLR